jgi:hypothetical protein
MLKQKIRRDGAVKSAAQVMFVSNGDIKRRKGVNFFVNKDNYGEKTLEM